MFCHDNARDNERIKINVSYLDVLFCFFSSFLVELSLSVCLFVCLFVGCWCLHTPSVQVGRYFQKLSSTLVSVLRELSLRLELFQGRF